MKKTKVAIVGVGSQGLGLVHLLRKTKQVEIVAVADINKNALEKVASLVPNSCLVTLDSRKIFPKAPDVLVEATSTITEAAILVRQAIKNKTHVILTNSEVDHMFGRLLAKEAESNDVILTSDAGDQPGVLIRTMNAVSQMGFEIVMAGNVKGFLDRYATPESITREAAERRLSLKQCTAYTDGTKLAIEMALVANAKGLDILQTGMMGPRIKRVQEVIGAYDLTRSRNLGGVVDFVLGAEPGGSVFVIGYSEDPVDRFYMDYYKMGKGPYYFFMRPYHLCHFETPSTIESITKYHEPVLVQQYRILEVGCRAKMDLQAGTKLEGIGGHHLYGMIEHLNSLPIGMAENTVLVKPKKRDEPISWDDVEFPQNDPRLDLWNAQAKMDH
ncbi:MAG: homoserine dehydrogenase [Candidatus Bathyarchaeia archaeon]